MVTSGGCTGAYSGLINSGEYLSKSHIFHEVKKDLLSILLQVPTSLVEKGRIRAYAGAIRHLRLLHPYEKFLHGAKTRWSRALPYYEARKEYGERNEEFFRKYGPPNDVLRELAKICRRENREVNTSQIENFIKLVEFHEQHYSSKFAGMHPSCTGGFGGL